MPVSANNYKTTLNKTISLCYNNFKSKRILNKPNQVLILDKLISLRYNKYITRDEQKGKINSVQHTRESKGP